MCIVVQMEGENTRLAEMAEEALKVATEVRDHQRRTRLVTQHITALLAYGLREHAFTDSAIGEMLGISRNRVSDLVQQAKYPDFDAIGDDLAFLQAQIATMYLPMTRALGGWVHTRTARSADIAADNNIALPDHWQGSPEGLDTAAAQFDNQDTGDRIVVYSLESQQGNPLLDQKKHCVGYDFKGKYRIDYRAAGAEPEPMSLEELGIRETSLLFGLRWPKPTERRYPDDAFANALRAIRSRYMIWPLPALVSDIGN